MKTKIFYVLILLSISVLLSGDSRPVSASKEQKRVRFQIATIGESAAGEREILAQTTIEGLPETDFNVNLQTENFKMQARFLSDLAATDKLKLRARLNTRRFYGYSSKNLPLYEEDAQNHTLPLGFDETVVLLPFGRGDAGTLKIEITPVLLSDSSDALKINIDQPLESGEITVDAFNNPHHFEVEAILLADGREIGRGAKKVLFDEEEEIILQPNDKAEKEIAQRPLTVRLAVNRYTRSRPQDAVGIAYKIFRAQDASPSPNAQNQAEIFTGAGITTLDGNLIYQLRRNLLPGDKKYELKFTVRVSSSSDEGGRSK